MKEVKRASVEGVRGRHRKRAAPDALERFPFIRPRLHPELFSDPDLALIQNIVEAGEAGKGEFVFSEGAGLRFETVRFNGRSAAGFVGYDFHIHPPIRVISLEPSRGRS